jgi:hypothetical protein
VTFFRDCCPTTEFDPPGSQTQLAMFLSYRICTPKWRVRANSSRCMMQGDWGGYMLVLARRRVRARNDIQLVLVSLNCPDEWDLPWLCVCPGNMFGYRNRGIEIV